MVYDVPVMSWSSVSRAGLVAAILGCSMPVQFASAQAGEPPVAPTLSWEAPPVCPGRDAVVRQVEAFLGQPFGTPRPQRISLYAAVQQVEDRSFVLRLTAVTVEGQSERVLQHGDCSELAKASALVMAVAIDPALQHRVSAGDAPPVPADGDSGTTTDSVAAPGPNAAQALRSEWVTLLQQPLMCPRPRAEACMACPPREPCPGCTERASPTASGPWRWSMWAEAAIASGVLPDLGPMVGAGLELGARDHWRLQLHGRYWIHQEADVPGYQGASVALRMLSAGARLCAVPFVSAWRMLGCVGPEVGDLRGAGKGEMRTKLQQHELWAALLASVGAEFPFGSRFLLTTSFEGGWAPGSIEVGVNEAQQWLQVTETSTFVADLAVRLGVALE